MVLPTALKMVSATGSITYFISSLTDTAGLRSPHNAACGASAVCAGGGIDFDGEHDVSVALRRTSPAHAAAS